MSNQNDNPFSRPSLASMAVKACIVSKAVYKENEEVCLQFIRKESEEGQHGLSRVFLSKFGAYKFLVVKHEESRTVYVAFRGTHNIADWGSNIKTSLQVCGTCSYHQGSLAKANEFAEGPLQKIVQDEEYEGKTFVFCGHSAGGQVATIAMIFMAQMPTYAFNDIWCFTFGTPSVGDHTLWLHCNRLGIDQKMFHIIREGDLVPLLLSYSQIMSALINDEGRQRLVDMWSQNLPPLKIALEVICLAMGKDSNWSLARDLVSTLNDACTSIVGRHEEQLYEHIGNFIFLTKEGGVHNVNCLHTLDKQVFLDRSLRNAQQHIPFSIAKLWDYHGIDNYLNTLKAVCMKRLTSAATNPQLVRNKYKPCITASKLTIKNGGFNLILHGKNLNGFVKEEFKCTISSFFNNFECDSIATDANDVEGIQITWTCLSSASMKASYKIELANPFHRCEVSMLYLTDEDTIDARLDMAVSRSLVLAAWDLSRATDTMGHQLQHHLSQVAELLNLQEKFNSLFPNQEAERQRQNQEAEELRQQLTSWGPDPARCAKFVEELQDHYSRPLSEDIHMFREIVYGSNTTCMKAVAGTCAIATTVFVYFREMANIASAQVKIQSLRTWSTGMFGIGSTCYGVMHAAVWSGVVPVLMPVLLTAAAGAFVAAAADVPFQKALELAPRALTTNVWLKTAFYGFYALTSWGSFAVDICRVKRVQRILGNNKGNYSSTLKALIKILKKMQGKVDRVEDKAVPDMENDVAKMWSDLNEQQRSQLQKSDLAQASEYLKCAITTKIEAVCLAREIRNVIQQQAFVAIIGLEDSGKTCLVNSIPGMWSEASHLNKHTRGMKVNREHEKRKILFIDFPGTNCSFFTHLRNVGDLLIMVVKPEPNGKLGKSDAKDVAKAFSQMIVCKSTEVIICINLTDFFQDAQNENKNPLKTKERLYVEDIYSELKKVVDEGVCVQKNSRRALAERILFTDWSMDSATEIDRPGVVGMKTVKERIVDYMFEHFHESIDGRSLAELKQSLDCE